jgi:hypothetical protein
MSAKPDDPKRHHAADHGAERVQPPVGGQYLLAQQRDGGLEIVAVGLDGRDETIAAGVVLAHAVLDQQYSVAGRQGRVGPHRAALKHDLRHEQLGRRHGGQRVPLAACNAPDPDHALRAIAQADHLDRDVSLGRQRLRGEDFPDAERNSEIGAQGVPGRIDDRQLLDRHGREARLPQGLEMGRATAIDAALREIGEAVDDPGQAGISHRDRAPGADGDLILPLLLDEIIEP